MKFNERELAAWASVLVPDKEGILEKKGTGIGQGYRIRWFRLKNNLLFYFRMDDNGDWQNHRDPLGVILLERVKVVKSGNDFKPYSFVLIFEGDDSRTLFLSAYSEAEMGRWMKAIERASYEGLQLVFHSLQRRLKTLTGEGTTPLLSPSHLKHGVSKKLEQPKPSPQYELSLSCSSLPLSREGAAPNTIIRVRSYQKAGDTQAQAIVGYTDIIQSCVSPHFTHLILLNLGPICTLSSMLQFEVFSVNDSQMYCPVDLSCKFTLPRDASSSVVLDCKHASDEVIELRKGLCIGKAVCLVRTIAECCGREMKIVLSSEKLVSGFLHIVSQRVDDPTSSGLTNPRDRCSQFGNLPSIMSHSIRCHFSFPASISGSPTRLKVIEEMSESAFNVQVPIELLKCYIKEDTRIFEELAVFGALKETWKDMTIYYQQLLLDSITINKRTIATLEDLGDTCGFKPSLQKREADLDMLLCNLHIQRLRVPVVLNGGKQEESSYVTITSGCPADHVSGFRNGGLKKMLSECKIRPSFVHIWGEAESPLSHTRVRLAKIKASIYDYNAKLYRACANANPLLMDKSMIGISKQIQLFFFLMESDIVKESIDALINARPSSNPGSFLSGSLGDLSSAMMYDDNRGTSLKRKSVALPITKCNCGLCSKCIPTPSDWVWNGSKFVQVSKEWKISDSSNSIQFSLCSLIDNVEAATKKVVDQRRLAVAPGFNLGTFKPTYVWSHDLIPLFIRLNQTLEGLFNVASSSLCFATMLHDSQVINFKALRRRRDVVFSQVLTALVTSFYTVLSHNFYDEVFLMQLRKLGFLVQFENLLSSLGDEVGMLEDMCVAVAELASVQFQLAEVKGMDRLDDVPYDLCISGTRDSLTVKLLFSNDILSELVDKPLKQGEKIHVVPILFTHGINEKQTLANIKQDLLLQSSLTLEANVNSKSMMTLAKYVKNHDMNLLEMKIADASSMFRATKVRELHSMIQQSSHKSRNIEFLLLVEQLVYYLRGGHLITCKSGKDRTGMSVTLEECCRLRNFHHLDANAFNQTLSTIRSHGTRLENCMKNTGHRCYNFNQLQLMLLPKLLTPPPFTCHE